MKNDDKPTVTRESDRFIVRLPDGMRDRLSASARESGRSMNAEVVARLQASYEPALSSLNWVELFKILQAEAQKLGAEISINIK
jgi:plasmid stability protein